MHHAAVALAFHFGLTGVLASISSQPRCAASHRHRGGWRGAQNWHELAKQSSVPKFSDITET